MNLKYVMLGNRGILSVGGADRDDFLQGLISNDIERVTVDRAIWAAYLTPQGKYLHDFFITEIDGVTCLDCESERLMDLGQRLHRHKLRAQIDLGLGEGLAVAVLFGDGALAALDLPAEPGAARALGDGVVYADPRLVAIGARAVLPVADATALLEARGFVAADPEAYDHARLALGLSDGSRDLIVEKSTLLESNFDELHGVDWDKGCYMGQELTARTKYRGLVKKRLLPVRLEGGAAKIGEPVMCNGKEIGEMRSSLGPRGLALIRLDRLATAQESGAALTAGTARVVPEKPDWAKY
jgi:folate-binding protein YgfZ